MGYYLLSAESGFSAAHTLPGVELCERFHGHDWRIRITVRVPEEAVGKSEMGPDFRDIEKLAQGTVEDFEHRYLNELDLFKELPPTAEHIARVVSTRAEEGLRHFAPEAAIAEVEVWETPTYRVVYRPS